MTQLVHLRLDPELIAEIEAYRVKTGIKTTSEATRRLISAGLAAEAPIKLHGADADRMIAYLEAEQRTVAAPSGSTRHAAREIVAERGQDKPAFEVAVYDPRARRATPKAPKGQKK